jgi:hypothetical protein
VCGKTLYAEKDGTVKCEDRKPKSRFVELPCEVGQTVYIIDYYEDECAEPYVLDVKVLQIFINKNGIALDLELPLGMRLNTWAVVGKNVFLTEEEAEKALAERSNT